MSFRRYNPDQINTRKFQLQAPDYALIRFASFGSLERMITDVALPSGQKMSTGKIEAGDVTATVLMRDLETCAVLEKWSRMTENGADGYIQPGTIELITASNQVGAVLEIEEMFCKGISYPETDEDGDGAPGRATVTFSVFVTRRIDLLADNLNA